MNLPLARARASHDEARAPWIGGRLPSGLGSALAATAAALAAAALYNSYHTRQVERRHPPTGRFIEVDGLRLHYLEQGVGTPVVLIHGNVVTAEDWILSGVLDQVAAQGHRVIAFDRPGYGYSDRPRGTAWSAQHRPTFSAGRSRTSTSSARLWWATPGGRLRPWRSPLPIRPRCAAWS